MTATTTATEFASELGEKLKHEAQKLHALEVVTRPLRKPEPKKKSKLGMLMVLIIGASTAYAIYRKLRPASSPETPAQTGPQAYSNGSQPKVAEPQKATAGL